MKAKTTSQKPARREPWWRAYRLHALLVLGLCLECALAASRHRTDHQVRRDLESGTPAEKVCALYLLTNRDLPQAAEPQFVRSLLASEETLIREWTMTSNFTRLGRPTAQRQYLNAIGESPEGIRCRFLFSHGIGKTPWITLPEVAAFLDALRGQP